MAPKQQKRLNAQIRESEVAVITEEGESLGILPIDQALDKAESLGVDLVEIGTQNGKVLCKLMDYGKFLFKQQKNQAHGKASSKKADLKTLKITYKIGDHDLDVRRKQAEKFAADGHPLKIMLTLRGRENNFVSLASAKIKEFVLSLGEFYKTTDMNITKAGNNFSTIIYPKK
jgi:translation initiation factor IF-3